MADIRAVIADVRAGVNAATPGLRDFGQLGGEARDFIRNLNDLVRQISREPARFLLDNRVPDYRR
jgi:phospholipid/cholesterol/gamma-HCH transport system substrate-binding protein